jgi:hypothetical protein
MLRLCWLPSMGADRRRCRRREAPAAFEVHRDHAANHMVWTGLMELVILLPCDSERIGEAFSVALHIKQF